MRLVDINADGSLGGETGPLSETARSVIESTVKLYARVGWVPPWIGYLALEDGESVGTCAFTRAPMDGEVEIAYFTFPGCEGRGVATRMARSLVSIAGKSDPGARLTAHTLPLENASTGVLRRAGFTLRGPVTHPDDGPIWVWHLVGKAAGQERSP